MLKHRNDISKQQKNPDLAFVVESSSYEMEKKQDSNLSGDSRHRTKKQPRPMDNDLCKYHNIILILYPLLIDIHIIVVALKKSI